jgi:hypothetical protein
VLDPFDPADMTPDERSREVAGLLARGYLRLLRKRAREPSAFTENALGESGDHAPPYVPGERQRAGRPRKEAR